MSIPIYDSRDVLYKKPFGAVPAGESISFCIRLPRLHSHENAVLKLFPMDEPERAAAHAMAFARPEAAANVYSCTITLQEPGLYAYYFEVYRDGSLRQIKLGEDGFARMDYSGMLWQLTVYDREMSCPDFLREGVMYQIFPDRFYNSGSPKENVPQDRILRQDWGGLPYWRPNEKGEVTNSDYFGGDLKGIEQKLDYLVGLGVTVLYLNPIFEAHSNHRYNTANYEKVDPLLGTEEDFVDLCKAAAQKGISIILDGVFSHTGSDSVYFNMEGRYGDGGAYRDPESPYRKWYMFHEYPHRYESWWGFHTLPNVQETEPGYMEYICGDKGILRKWMKLGARGYRLDVADELPDEFLDELRKSIKSCDENGAIIGEVWEDASNKQSYGQRRRYLLGRQLDSVMNYPFKDAVLTYMRHGNGEYFYKTIMQILENYPKPVLQAMMNSLSTHDTARAITELGGGGLVDSHDRHWQEAHQNLPQDQYDNGCRLFALACILQFGLPGIPCVYYGDEAGLVGYKDPFNRVCYPWGGENQQLVEHIAALGKMRRDYPVFADADFRMVTINRDVCAFIRVLAEQTVYFAINRSDTPKRLELPESIEPFKAVVQYGEYHDGTLEGFSGVVMYTAI